MLTRALGRTGLTVPPLVLGGNVFGWTADRPTSFAILDRAFDAGLTAIDTADSYSRWVPGHQGGESESIIGDWMAGRGIRSEITLITKVGSGMGEGRKGLSARYITQAVEASLQRLQTDWIDLYLAHWPDPETPWDETLLAFQNLLTAGKVRAIGACNLSAEQLITSLQVAERENLPQYQVLQPLYNLVERGSFESDLLQLCLQHELGVIPHSALARGFLTGKYRDEVDLSKSPRGERMRSYLDQPWQLILTALDQVASAQRSSVAAVALAWLAAQPGVTAPIASASTVEQVEDLIAATRLQLRNPECMLLELISRAAQSEGLKR